MKRKALLFIIALLIPSLFFVEGIFGLLVYITNPVSNSFSIYNPNAYTITYVYNNGDSNTTATVSQNSPITTFPNHGDYNDCDPGTGSYESRNCTYVYSFSGWYLEPTFVTEVDETYVPTANTTLYARWNKIYFSIFIFLIFKYSISKSSHFNKPLFFYHRFNHYTSSF